MPRPFKMTFEVRTLFKTEAFTPAEALRDLLVALKTPGTPVIVEVVECGGMGGGVESIVLLDADRHIRKMENER
jgi:hypothetical protein